MNNQLLDNKQFVLELLDNKDVTNVFAIFYAVYCAGEPTWNAELQRIKMDADKLKKDKKLTSNEWREHIYNKIAEKLGE